MTWCRRLLIVSSSVLSAMAQGKGIGRGFDEMVKREFRDDIYVLRNLKSFVWGAKGWLTRE